MKRHPVRTARARPKEALLRKRSSEATDTVPRMDSWLTESERLASEIRSQQGEISVDELLRLSRQDLENRDE